MDVKAASVTKRFGLSGNALKVIAIIAMTIDHVAWMRIEAYEQAEPEQFEDVQKKLHMIEYKI